MAVLTNPTDLARETLKLLATRRIAPTPANYQRYYHEIAGTAARRESAEERLGKGCGRWRRRTRRSSPSPGLRACSTRATWRFHRPPGGHRERARSRCETRLGAVLRDLLRQTRGAPDRHQPGAQEGGLERLLINFGSDPLLFDKLQALCARGARSRSPPPPGRDGPRPAARSGGRRPPAAPASAGQHQADQRAARRRLWSWAWPRGWSAFPELARRSAGAGPAGARGARRRAWTRLAAQLKQFWYSIELRARPSRSARFAAPAARPAGQQHRRAGGG